MEDRIKTSMPEEKKNVHTPSAAILIPIVRDKDEPALLMEVRSLNVLQPGKSAFPVAISRREKTVLIRRCVRLMKNSGSCLLL